MNNHKNNNKRTRFIPVYTTEDYRQVSRKLVTKSTVITFARQRTDSEANGPVSLLPCCCQCTRLADRSESQIVFGWGWAAINGSVERKTI